MSEEFLRKYESGEAFEQTIDEAVRPGQELFEKYAAPHETKGAPSESKGGQ